MSFKCNGDVLKDCANYGSAEGKSCKNCEKAIISKNANIDWVFWIDISIRKEWFTKFWKTRGANFLEIQFFNLRIGIGMPWLNTYLTYFDYMDENIYKTNIDNAKRRFSFLIKSKH